MERTRLRIAIQKSGRLADDSFGLLQSAGLKIQRNKSGLFYRIKNLPMDLLLVRDDDIPGFVRDGITDLGIAGANVYEEFSFGHEGPRAITLMRLGFSRCSLCLAVPDTQPYDDVSSLTGLTIATSYPRILNAFLEASDVAATIVEMHGAVEVAPKLGIADAVCDIVSSGATLEANGLRLVEDIFKSEALLLKTRKALSRKKEDTINRLLSRFEGVKASKETKYIMLNAPRSAVGAVTKLLPGAEAPTIMPLEGEPDAVAIHAVCRESVFWETMEELRKAGASSILILPIEKMLA